MTINFVQISPQTLRNCGGWKENVIEKGRKEKKHHGRFITCANFSVVFSSSLGSMLPGSADPIRGLSFGSRISLFGQEASSSTKQNQSMLISRWETTAISVNTSSQHFGQEARIFLGFLTDPMIKESSLYSCRHSMNACEAKIYLALDTSDPCSWSLIWWARLGFADGYHHLGGG